MSSISIDLHKQHLSFLFQCSDQDVTQFASKSFDYISEGPSKSAYLGLSKSFDQNVETIQNGLESFLYVFAVCSKSDVTEHEFQRLFSILGFGETQVKALHNLYLCKKGEITDSHVKADNLLYFHDLQWRFEAKIGSRSLVNQMTPLVTMHFKFSDSPRASEADRIDNCLLQTDPTTIIEITKNLENALRLSRSRLMRKMATKVKKLVPNV